jgi:hypothetical protein
MCILCGRKLLRLEVYKIHKNLTDKLLKSNPQIGKAKGSQRLGRVEALLDLMLSIIPEL